MSYTSTSEFRRGTSLLRVREVVELLGYQPIRDSLRVPNMVGNYIWYDESEYKSWTGVELQIYRKGKKVSVDTRSRSSRSYWDLVQQNKTIKLLRDLFGGYFETDAGRNRYWRPDELPPTPLSSGCFIARWRFHNALIKARVYLQTRNLEGDMAKDAPTGLSFLDDMNPRLLSNNLLIPYVLAIWEDYYRSTFAAVLKYADRREAVLKKARLSHAQLEQIASERRPVEHAIADCFSFQRPSLIGEHFNLIDAKINLAAALRKPYRGRKITLFDSIEALVEGRNAFVHAGEMNLALFDRALETTFGDIVEAVDRCYKSIGKHFGFVPIEDF